ncbi:MAG: O-antigen ligase family protein [Acidobacteriia bacterium]|nr:O-antigen ligase family protein [Terriglobia bacterium]
MSPTIATIVFAMGIVGLFALDRERKAQTSKALWIPVVWLLINGSRPVSAWLAAGGFVDAPSIDSPDQYLDGSPIDRAVFACLLVAGLMVLFSRRRQVGALLRRNAPILLFFSYCALSILWSAYSFVAFKRWTKAVGDLVMVVIVLTDSEPEAALKRLIARAGFLLVPLSVLFIKYYPDLGRVYNNWTWSYMYTGVTMGKNLLGMLCLFAGLGSAWCFLSAYRDREGARRNQRLLAHAIVLLTVPWLLWVADSVTSFVCFLLGGVLMVTAGYRGLARRPAVLHLLVTATVTVCLFALFIDTAGGLVASLGRDLTLTGRTAIWNLVLSLRGSSLVGTGFESFWLGDRLREVWSIMPGIQEAHNGYLEVYLNLGWIGVTLLGVLMVTGYRNIMAAFRHDLVAARIRLAYFVVAVIYSLTEAGFRMMSLSWIFFLLAITAVPEALASENLSPLGIHHTDNFAEYEPQVDPVYCSGSQEGVT